MEFYAATLRGNITTDVKKKRGEGARAGLRSPRDRAALQDI